MKLCQIYFDYAASTPVDPRVQAAMLPYFNKIFANPHSLHQLGQEASRGVFEARRTIAKSIGADYKQIVFTGSATEANNLALRGVLKGIKKPRIITTAIEHESILETCRDLEKDGVEVVYLPVSRDGLVDLKKLKASLNERTVLVSVMHVNNEVGVVQPIAEIATIIKNWKLKIKNSDYPLFHTDAVQSFQYLDCNVNKLGVDLMTISAHKIYGPKGIGLLYIGRPDLLAPIRTGTPNVPYIVGFAKAVEIADQLRAKEGKRVDQLRDYFWKELRKKLPELERNGSARLILPNNLNVYFPGQTAQDLLIKLDLAGIATSPGAACTTRVSKTSYVLEALGFPEKRAGGSLRFSLGRQTTKKDIDFACRTIISVLKSGIIKLRNAQF